MRRTSTILLMLLGIPPAWIALELVRSADVWWGWAWLGGQLASYAAAFAVAPRWRPRAVMALLAVNWALTIWIFYLTARIS